MTDDRHAVLSARMADALATSVLELYDLAKADDWRMRRAIDQAVERLSAMLEAGRVSRTELQAVVDELRTAAELPSVFGDHRRDEDDGDGVSDSADATM